MSGRLRDRVESEANRLLRERVVRLKQALEQALASMGEPLQFPLSPGEWGAASGTDQLNALRDGIESIGRGATQREILTSLLDAVAAFYPRAALFIVKGSSLTGWAGLGFLGEGGFDSRHLPRVTLAAGADHLPAQALEKRAFVHSGPEGPGREVIATLGGVKPRAAAAMPLLVRGRPVALLYGDTGRGDQTGQALAFEIVGRIAGLAMDRLAAEAPRRGPAAGAEASNPAGAAAPVRALPARGGSPTPPEEAEMEALLTDLEGHPRRQSGDDGLSDDERRIAADARRFARLLVSELLLYNEEAVVLGRKHRDLNERLRKEIDRSRQAYQARVPAQIARRADFFEEELVRVLAHGDPSILRN
jgi:hypothetical protein